MPAYSEIEFLTIRNTTIHAVLQSVLHHREMATSRLMYEDFFYIHIALGPSEFTCNRAVSCDFSERNYPYRLEYPEAFFSYLTAGIDFFPAVCISFRLCELVASVSHFRRRVSSTKSDDSVNVAWSAVARQIDYVLAKGILRRVPNPPFFALLHMPLTYSSAFRVRRIRQS